MDTIKIKHVALKDYASGEHRAEVDYTLRYGQFKSVDHFNIGDILDNTFGFVKAAQEELNFKGMTFDRFINLLQEHKGVDLQDLKDMSVYTLQEARLWLKDAIESVNKIESEQLGSLPSEDEKRAGIENFAKYRAFPQFDALAGGDLLKQKEIEKLPYSLCFTKLMLENERAEFNNRLSKIRMKKK